MSIAMMEYDETSIYIAKLLFYSDDGVVHRCLVSLELKNGRMIENVQMVIQFASKSKMPPPASQIALQRPRNDLKFEKSL
jgi:hypothetical protein